MRLLPALITAILVLPIVQQAYADFSFHSQYSYVDETKFMHILGKVQNDSASPVGNVLITISFYDGEGNLLDRFSRTPELQVINPGESSPFEILYINQTSVDRVANFTMSAAGQDAELKEKKLEIISSNSRLDLLGVYYINSAAKNNGSEDAANAVMIATLYDKDDRVVAIGKALAEDGRRNWTASSEAAFGIAVTDKLQTYKATRYSLVVDSDQYMSSTVVLQASGPGISPPGNQTQSGCLIATAAFGSELAPQVQQLRFFRDGIALRTAAGSSFMNVFNAWYYSFSPQVADYERQEPWLQSAVRALVYPLLGILNLSTFVNDSFAFSGELGIVAAGMTASSLIGLLYFAPLGVVLGIASRKRQWSMSKARIGLACSWAAGAAAVIVAELTVAEPVMMFGTSLLVLSAIATTIVAVARAVRS